ncbi:MAG: glycine cleavage system protein GcvH [Desulfobacteraceae bacterium]|jgi:glycine cleavage system H protein|nr:MAG: glycine cleavage system protein GcvH [Desulfobacteraceae bacterium]
MKELDELNLPEDVRYAEDHEWVKTDSGTTRIGISDYAQDQLGDIVYVELPSVGQTLNKGDAFGTVESVKAVSELYMPIGGEVTAVNKKLEDSPDLVNVQPYGEGWMIEIKSADPAEMDSLMTKQEYLKMLKEKE